jgi:hypothetical protein
MENEMRKHIDNFKNFVIKEGLFTKKNKNQKIIDDILKTQGKNIDQRMLDDRKIYTEEELSSMDYEEIIKIWRKMFHPRGRWW